MGISAKSDRIPSHRTPFLLGLVLAIISTLCLALGTTLPVLLFARLLEGLSTAIVATEGYALMCEAVGQEYLSIATRLSSGSSSMGSSIGPVMGGLLYEYVGYYETFFPVLLLVGAEVALRMLVIEDKEQGTAAASGHKGSKERKNRATESRPLLPPPPRPIPTQTQASNNVYRILLTNPNFLTSLTNIFILNSTTSAFSAVLPAYVSSTFSLGPLHASALFLFLTLPTLYPPLAYNLTSRFNTNYLALYGLAIGAPSLAALSLVGLGTGAPMLKLGVLFLLIGVALALALAPLQIDAAATVATIAEQRPRVFGSRGAYARAFGLVNGVVAAGGLLGPLAAGYARIWIGWEGMAVAMGGLSLLVFGSVVVCMGWKV